MSIALECRRDVLISPNYAERAVLVIHGMGGSKADAEQFADRAATHRWQMVSVDPPQSYQPWDCGPVRRGDLRGDGGVVGEDRPPRHEHRGMVRHDGAQR